MHAQAFAFVAEAVKTHGATAPVYEIGSRNINGTVRSLFDRSPGAYLGIDLYAGPDVDLVENAATYLPPSPVATVVCCEVLEHTAEAEAIIHRACEALQPGGLLIVTCAGPGRKPHSAIDGHATLYEGEHYQNITAEALEAWAEAGGLDATALSVTAPSCDTYMVGRKR
jgi:hypothetical protein